MYNCLKMGPTVGLVKLRAKTLIPKTGHLEIV